MSSLSQERLHLFSLLDSPAMCSTNDSQATCSYHLSGLFWPQCLYVDSAARCCILSQQDALQLNAADCAVRPVDVLPSLQDTAGNTCYHRSSQQDYVQLHIQCRTNCYCCINVALCCMLHCCSSANYAPGYELYQRMHTYVQHM